MVRIGAVVLTAPEKRYALKLHTPGGEPAREDVAGQARAAERAQPRAAAGVGVLEPLRRVEGMDAEDDH